VTDPEPALLIELTKARAHIAELEAERDAAKADLSLVPADPAGLDAALQAVGVKAGDRIAWANPGRIPSAGEINAWIEDMLRAAAPHLRAAALNEAADELPHPKPGDDDLVILAVEAIRTWLRERAGQELNHD